MLNCDYSRFFEAAYVERTHGGEPKVTLIAYDKPLEELIEDIIQQDLRNYIYSRWSSLVGGNTFKGESVKDFTDKIIIKVVDSLITFGEVQIGLGNFVIKSEIDPFVTFNTFEARRVDM